MALVSTQPLTEISTTNISWGGGGKGGRCVGLTLPPSSARLSRNLGASTPWSPVGACNGLALPFVTERCEGSSKETKYLRADRTTHSTRFYSCWGLMLVSLYKTEIMLEVKLIVIAMPAVYPPA
jgi:hypothetical protein